MHLLYLVIHQQLALFTLSQHTIRNKCTHCVFQNIICGYSKNLKVVAYKEDCLMHPIFRELISLPCTLHAVTKHCRQCTKLTDKIFTNWKYSSMKCSSSVLYGEHSKLFGKNAAQLAEIKQESAMVWTCGTNGWCQLNQKLCNNRGKYINEMSKKHDGMVIRISKSLGLP